MLQHITGCTMAKEFRANVTAAYSFSIPGTDMNLLKLLFSDSSNMIQYGPFTSETNSSFIYSAIPNTHRYAVFLSPHKNFATKLFGNMALNSIFTLLFEEYDRWQVIVCSVHIITDLITSFLPINVGIGLSV